MTETAKTVCRLGAYRPRLGALVERPCGEPRLESFPDALVVDTALVPDGVAALVSDRVSGAEADNSPRLIVRRGDRRDILTLPERPGQHVVARSVTVTWPRIVVRGTTFDASDAAGAPPVRWESNDGGGTWTTG